MIGELGNILPEFFFLWCDALGNGNLDDCVEITHGAFRVFRESLATDTELGSWRGAGWNFNFYFAAHRRDFHCSADHCLPWR